MITRSSHAQSCGFKYHDSDKIIDIRHNTRYHVHFIWFKETDKYLFLLFSGILGSNVIHISIFQLNWTQVKQYLPKQTVDISFAVVTWFVIVLSTVFICFMFKLLTTDHLPSKRCGKENESSNLLRRNFPRVRMFILFCSEMSIIFLRSGDSDILNLLISYYRVSRRQSMHGREN